MFRKVPAKMQLAVSDSGMERQKNVSGTQREPAFRGWLDCHNDKVQRVNQ